MQAELREALGWLAQGLEVYRCNRCGWLGTEKTCEWDSPHPEYPDEGVDPLCPDCVKAGLGVFGCHVEEIEPSELAQELLKQADTRPQAAGEVGRGVLDQKGWVSELVLNAWLKQADEAQAEGNSTFEIGTELVRKLVRMALYALSSLQQPESARVPKLMKVHTPRGYDCPAYVLMAALNETVAYANHQQSLERLNERGGLDIQEIYAIRHSITDWRKKDSITDEAALAECRSIRWPALAPSSSGGKL